MLEVEFVLEGELHCLDVEVGSGYVGRNDSWGDGHSLLILVDALVASNRWALSHLR